MSTIIFTLLVSGIVSGLVQYLVDFRKLTTPTLEALEGVDTETGARILNFLKEHWQIPAYMIIGFAGAALVPMLHAIVPLKGLDAIKAYAECVPDQVAKKTCYLDNWTVLVLLGYGIVLGYSAVRMLKSVGAMLMGRLSAVQGAQLMTAARIENLESRMLSLNGVPDYMTSQNAVNLYDDDHGSLEMLNSSVAAAAPGPCIQNPPPWNGKPYRTAESIKKLLQQVNRLAPNRNKSSDGIIGDLNHQQTTSDHNPWVLDGTIGVVTALDITHDPTNKCNCKILAKSLETGKDARIKYVIWNRKIMSSTVAAWTWRPYSGANPHDKHIHISVNCDKPSYDSTIEWMIKLS